MHVVLAEQCVCDPALMDVMMPWYLWVSPGETSCSSISISRFELVSQVRLSKIKHVSSFQISRILRCKCSLIMSKRRESAAAFLNFTLSSRVTCKARGIDARQDLSRGVRSLPQDSELQGPQLPPCWLQRLQQDTGKVWREPELCLLLQGCTDRCSSSLLPSRDVWGWLSILIWVSHSYSVFWPHGIPGETSQLSLWNEPVYRYFKIFFHPSFPYLPCDSSGPSGLWCQRELSIICNYKSGGSLSL